MRHRPRPLWRRGHHWPHGRVGRCSNEIAGWLGDPLTTPLGQLFNRGWAWPWPHLQHLQPLPRCNRAPRWDSKPHLLQSASTFFLLVPPASFPHLRLDPTPFPPSPKDTTPRRPWRCETRPVGFISSSANSSATKVISKALGRGMKMWGLSPPPTPLITGTFRDLPLGEPHGQPFVNHHAGVDVAAQPTGFGDHHLAVDEEGALLRPVLQRRRGDVMVFADVLVVLQPLDLDVIRMETVNHASEGDFGLSHLLGVRREDEDERRGDLAYEKKTVGVGQNRRVWWVLGFFFGWGGAWFGGEDTHLPAWRCSC